MLGQISEWFYQSLVFWGTPLVIAVAWALIKRIRNKKSKNPWSTSGSYR